MHDRRANVGVAFSVLQRRPCLFDRRWGGGRVRYVEKGDQLGGDFRRAILGLRIMGHMICSAPFAAAAPLHHPLAADQSTCRSDLFCHRSHAFTLFHAFSHSFAHSSHPLFLSQAHTHPITHSLSHSFILLHPLFHGQVRSIYTFYNNATSRRNNGYFCAHQRGERDQAGMAFTRRDSSHP